MFSVVVWIVWVQNYRCSYFHNMVHGHEANPYQFSLLFSFYFHPFFFSSFRHLVVCFMLFESKLILHKCWLVVFASIISVARIWIFLFGDTWLQNMCDSQLLIGVHFVIELSAPTVGPRGENMVLVLSLAWRVKHPSGTLILYSGGSECVPGDQRQWLGFFCGVHWSFQSKIGTP